MKLPILTIAVFALSHALICAVPEFTEDGYRVPQPGTVLQEPAMHGSHPDYRIEWWYLTGHLSSGDQEFGYQATFFRYALKPNDSNDASLPDPDFGDRQLHMTHMALTDIKGRKFHFQQRIHREGWDAGASVGSLDVHHGNWSIYAVAENPLQMRLTASAGSNVRWQLSLVPEKPLVRFGEDGTSRKGPAPEARSFYHSFTRLATTGTVHINGTEYAVTGSSWMDHEISSSQLDPDYTGWDWIAIQLDDGWEVKAYLLRDANDRPSQFSALIWIAPDGELFYRTVDEFNWEKPTFWTSPQTAALYPTRPLIRTTHPVSGLQISFAFIPVLDDQELSLPGTTYWEGAGRIRNADGQFIGRAYLELVGYAGPIEGLR